MSASTAPGRRLPAWTTSLAGLTLALLFWWLSLTPTLIPRGWIVQGATSGLCLAVGYGIGLLAGRALGWLLGRAGRAPGAVLEQRARIGLAVAGAAVGLAGIVIWVAWQNDARDLVEVPRLGWWEGAPMAVLSAAVGMVLVWIGHRTHGGLRTVNRFNHRHLAGWLAAPATILLVLAVVVFVGRDVLFRGFVWVANSTYGALDDGTNEGIVRPTSTAVSGSPDSLVAWDSLGRWGRNFVAQATTREQLVAFHGADAALSEPVRVYVGLRTSHDAEEQAALAVRELERTGGFERSVLAVWVPTGAGWMDPDAAMALEELCAGDTAIVATQYSFLPSFFSLIVDVGKATEAGAALFNAVHERWAQLPEADRPQLIVFGLSLGAWGAEAPFVGVDAASSVANFVARADGAVIVGSKQDNPILSQLTADREPGSPVWQPVVDGGRIVRFATRGSELAGLDPAWHRPHIVYLQHPTDAVTYWGVDDFWSPAEWMDVPRGLDVPKVGGWFPIVSGIQGLADLSFQLTLPPGHGHDYRPDYVAAFASVVTPAGWTEADTARLATFLRPPDP